MGRDHSSATRSRRAFLQSDWEHTEAQDRLRKRYGADWDRWELSSHEIEIPAPAGSTP
jgi:hypothetical protein